MASMLQSFVEEKYQILAFGVQAADSPNSTTLALTFSATFEQAFDFSREFSWLRRTLRAMPLTSHFLIDVN